MKCKLDEKFNLTKFEAYPISFKTLKNNTHTHTRIDNDILLFKLRQRKTKFGKNKKYLNKPKSPPKEEKNK